MPHLSSPDSSLYRINECPELMADACLCDEQRSLIFLSIWGRDTAVQEFLARLTLPTDEGGLDQFHVVMEDDLQISIFAPNAKRFTKRSTRAYRRTLFGSLVHLWLFDKRCIEPNKASGTALAVLPKGTTNQVDRLWALVRETCPLPLLDHWRDTVMELLQARGMLAPLSFSFGPVEGYSLSIDIPAVTSELGELIRAGALGISPADHSSAALLKQVA